MAFRKYAESKREWADVVALIQAACEARTSRLEEKHVRSGENRASPVSTEKVHHATLKDRGSYGGPMQLPGFRHEPVNEQGVMVLFGMFAKELGYLIEAVQAGFPDCEAKRRISAERWQRVHIEFEFESRNYRDHGHPLAGCDVIVCWRHNWESCPAHIEVLELSQHVKREGEP